MKTKTKSSSARRRRAWWLALAALPLAGLALVLGLTCRPAWYTPASVDYRLLDEDKRAELAFENRISAALNADQAVEITLDQQQVNRWIAARHELWPGEPPSLEPLEAPQVYFLDHDRIRLAGVLRRAGLAAVVSVVLELELADDRLELRWQTPRAGLVPLPGLDMTRLLGRLNLPGAQLQAGRLTLPTEGVWPNGRRRFRLVDLDVSAGELRLRLVPLP